METDALGKKYMLFCYTTDLLLEEGSRGWQEG